MKYCKTDNFVMVPRRYNQLDLLYSRLSAIFVYLLYSIHFIYKE